MSQEHLVIVESPAKARTVGKFLGKEYVVKASVGHIRDLPKRILGVDVQNGFTPRYVLIKAKEGVVKDLKESAKSAAAIYLATDPDREGEAIAWHLVAALKAKNKPIHRVEFHEITKQAISTAFAEPREINMSLVNAQQARRILDRLVGYSISPLLSRKVSRRGLSAGRVQSVAVRLIVEREREIQSFVPQEYWSLEAELAKADGGHPKSKRLFIAALHQIRGEAASLPNEETTKAIVADLEGASYVVGEVRKREQERHPPGPFTTSTLQQEASRKLGFGASRTMRIAQQLYEGLPIGGEGEVGLITYMRTDSTNLAEAAVAEMRSFIQDKYGPKYLPPQPRIYKTKVKGAQEAHEAVRPTAAARTPESIKNFLSQDQYRLYKLIWQRALACQMASAIQDKTSVDILAGPADGDRPYLFRATGSITKFPGFLTLYKEGHDEEEEEEEEEKSLPPLERGELLSLVRLIPEQHFTKPPPRYTEASLVKALEQYGIGRPSTYAPTLSTIQQRGYVQLLDRKLAPSEMGYIVNDLVIENFADIVDVGFTASMEEKLDEIASGQQEWTGVLRDFYTVFQSDLSKAETGMRTVELVAEPAGIDCEKCGRPMLIKLGRFGRFMACSGFPACRNSKSILVGIGVYCPECGGEIVERRTRRKRIFYGCANYPTCKFASWRRPLPTPCPRCDGLMVQAAGSVAECTKCDYKSSAEEEKLVPTG